MRAFLVLICSFVLMRSAHGETAHAKTSQHAPAKMSQRAPAKTSQNVSAHGVHPAGVSSHQRAQAPQRPATIGGRPPAGLAVGPTGPESHPQTGPAGNAAASVPTAPVYHYNFPTKSTLIGRDFTRPLTTEEQSAIARQIANGQPTGTQAAPRGHQYDNGVYHYDFPTKSGLIGHDFTRPLTPQEQATIGRQIANGQPTGIQAPSGGAPASERIGAGAAAAREAEIEDAKKRGAIITDRATKLAPPPAHGKVNPFRPQHFDLPNKPDPAIAGVKFEGTGHIPGSETWTGPKYAAFCNYHHDWHNREWWRHHYPRIVLIAGGWYFWRSRYWYPAWGYSTADNYYPYDGPIYAYNDLAPDQVVANVQAALQALGYYHGPINGLLDPATRDALANYQRDKGLYTTSAIDESTLAALGMA